MDIIKSSTPNPLAKKFTVSSGLFTDTKRYALFHGETCGHPLLNTLLKINGVEHVFGFQNFVTILIKKETMWDEVIPIVEEKINAYLHHSS